MTTRRRGAIVLLVVAVSTALILWKAVLPRYARARAEETVRSILGPSAQIGAVRIRGLSRVVLRDVILPDATEGAAPLIRIARTTIQCDFLSAFGKRFNIRSITILNPVIRRHPGMIAGIGRPSATTALPAVYVENAEVVFDKDALYAGSPPMRLTGGSASFESVAGSSSCFRAVGRAGADFGAQVGVTLDLDVAAGQYRFEAAAPRVPLDDRIMALLPAGQASLWTSARPEGTVNADIVYEGNWATGDGKLTARVELNDCRLAFETPTVSISDLVGRLEYSDGRISATGVRGSVLGASVSLDRFVINDLLTAPALELKASVSDLAMSKQLADALPARMRGVFDIVNPSDGRCRLTYDFSQLLADPATRRSRGVIELQDVTATPSHFPYPVTRLNGAVEFDDRHILLHDVVGSASGGVVTILGEVIPHTGGAQIDLEVTGQRVALSPDFINALPREAGAVFKEYGIEGGSVDATWKFHRPAGAGIVPVHHVLVNVSGVAARFVEFPYPLKSVSGKVEWTRGDATLTDIRGVGPDGRSLIEVGGRITAGAPDDRPNVIISAHRLPLDETLKQALPPDALKYWRLLEPTGAIDATAALTIAQGTGLKRIEIEAQCLDCAVKCAPFNYTAEQINGRATYDGADLILHDVSSRGPKGEGRIVANGRIPISSDATQLNLELNVEGLPLDKRLLGTLPDDLRAFAESLSLEGSLNMRVLLGCEAADGKYVLVTKQAATLKTDNLNVHGWPLQEFAAVFSAGAKTITIDSARGQSGTGEFTASGLIERGGGNAFEISLACRNLDVTELIRSAGIGDPRTPGYLDAQVEMRGHGADSQRLEGEGRLLYSSGRLEEVNLFQRLLNTVVTFVKPGNPPTRAEADFTLGQGIAEFESIELTGDTIPFYGSGTAMLDGRINMTFVTGRASTWFFDQLPLIGPMLNDISRYLPDIQSRLVSVEVGGTLREPEAVVVPLPPARDLVVGFLNLFRSAQPTPPAGP